LLYFLISRLVETHSWPAILISIILLALTVYAVVGMYFRLRASDQAAYGDYCVQRQAWDQAQEKWNRLYYCSRHDIVFDPDKPGESCQPRSLLSFIGLG
jgi:hypothetical protein